MKSVIKERCATVSKRKKKPKLGGRRPGAGRPRSEEPSVHIRVSASSVERIAAAQKRHGLNARVAADMLIEMGEAYDGDDTPAFVEGIHDELIASPTADASAIMHELKTHLRKKGYDV